MAYYCKILLTLDALKFKALIDMRRTLQTSSRQRSSQRKEADDEKNEALPTSQRYTPILRDTGEAQTRDDQAIGTGYERSEQWTTDRVQCFHSWCMRWRNRWRSCSSACYWKYASAQ